MSLELSNRSKFFRVPSQCVSQIVGIVVFNHSLPVANLNERLLQRSGTD